MLSAHDAELQVDGRSLQLQDVAKVARARARVKLSASAKAEMARSFAWVQAAADGEIRSPDGQPMPVYGVNTGYGSLARHRIEPSQIRALSWNLVRSHAAGVGPPLPEPAVRAMMLLRANALARGASGCRPVLVETLLEMLNRGVIPVVPSRGSCGSSGDLAPLSHLALVLFRGEEDEPSGDVRVQGDPATGAEGMRRVGLERLFPAPKEGLAMTNGAQLTTALGALACVDAEALVLQAEIAAAMTFEALRGVTRALHPEVHKLRPFPGAIACAANLRRLLDGSGYVDSMPEKLQDAYSLRCTPQILGGVRDGIRFAGQQINVELNAVTDNPLILMDQEDLNKAFSAGMFHGEPIGLACDHLKLCVAELASLSERRIFRLTTGTLSARLPPLLVQKDRPGIGQMVPQTTAAALVSENRALGYPSTIDSIPTCEDQEDVVAMSTSAARRATEVVWNSQRVVAIELMSAAHAIWWRRAEEPRARLGAGTQAALDVVESLVGRPGACPGDDIALLAEAVESGRFLAEVEAAVGPLERVHV